MAQRTDERASTRPRSGLRTRPECPTVCSTGEPADDLLYVYTANRDYAQVRDCNCSGFHGCDNADYRRSPPSNTARSSQGAREAGTPQTAMRVSAHGHRGVSPEKPAEGV